MTALQDTGAPLVLREEHDGLVTLRLNRPLQFNALSEAMLAALQAELDLIAQQPDVRCVVLAAEGKAFCAGHDLRQMQATRRLDYYQTLFAQCSRVMQAIQTLPVPVIARVHGSATPSVALSRNVSTKRAFDMLVTGRFIDADTAADWGLVNETVADAALDEAVARLAQQIMAKSPTAVRYGKQMFYRQRQLPLDEAYAYAGDVMARNMMEEDAEEGVAAFLEKRPPSWARP